MEKRAKTLAYSALLKTISVQNENRWETLNLIKSYLISVLSLKYLNGRTGLLLATELCSFENWAI